MNHVRSSRAGFSLLEIIIAMSIIAILVGVVGFRSSGAIQRGHASSLIQLIKTLEKASAAHYADTGLYPNEYEVTYTAVYRQLSGTQTYNGWQGPYIERPLANNDTNPFGTVRQYNSLQANSWVAGFDTDGDGTNDVAGTGCLLYLTGLPEAVVKSIDSSIDGGIPGDWKATGRVVWQQGSNHTLVYIFK